MARLPPGHRLASGEAGPDLILTVHHDLGRMPFPGVGEQVCDGRRIAEIDEMAVRGDEPFDLALVQKSLNLVVHLAAPVLTPQVGVSVPRRC